MEETSQKKSATPPGKLLDSAEENLTLAAIREAVAGIRFGMVQLIIQDGRVVQIDKTEKIRLV